MEECWGEEGKEFGRKEQIPGKKTLTPGTLEALGVAASVVLRVENPLSKFYMGPGPAPLRLGQGPVLAPLVTFPHNPGLRVLHSCPNFCLPHLPRASMGAGAQGGHMGRFNTIPEKEDGGRGLEWAWMKRWKEWVFLLCPHRPPPFPRG